MGRALRIILIPTPVLTGSGSKGFSKLISDDIDKDIVTPKDSGETIAEVPAKAKHQCCLVTKSSEG